MRPGEKMHEVLVSVDESHHTLEYDRFFVITPAHPWWHVAHWADGRRLPDGYCYASDTNTDWLSVEQLRSML